ncbi:MAG: hypothetical protein ACK5MR_06855 [Cumulibacter sp.]
MNPSILPPQGKYADDHLQQMVLDELARQEVTPDKFYFTSDDWMVTYDGPTPAWNSIFGVAAYRKDGQTFYAECGVSQRYDAATAQWGAPAATVKTGLPLDEASFQAAPSALGPQSGAVPTPAAPPADAAGTPAMPDNSQTMMATRIPDLPAAGSAGAAAAPGADQSDAGADQSDAGLGVLDPEPETETTSSAHDVPDSGAMPPADSQPSGAAAGSAEQRADGDDLREAGDLGVDESAPSPESPSYEAAGAEAEARQHPEIGHQANVAGYALRVNEDGTAELQVPLGGSVTLRWAGAE